MELVNRLIERDIDILRMNDVLMVIDTPHVYVQFVVDPNKLHGRRPDKIFSSIDLVLNYILQEEGM